MGQARWRRVGDQGITPGPCPGTLSLAHLGTAASALARYRKGNARDPLGLRPTVGAGSSGRTGFSRRISGDGRIPYRRDRGFGRRHPGLLRVAASLAGGPRHGLRPDPPSESRSPEPAGRHSGPGKPVAGHGGRGRQQAGARSHLRHARGRRHDDLPRHTPPDHARGSAGSPPAHRHVLLLPGIRSGPPRGGRRAHRRRPRRHLGIAGHQERGGPDLRPGSCVCRPTADAGARRRLRLRRLRAAHPGDRGGAPRAGAPPLPAQAADALDPRGREGRLHPDPGSAEGDERR